MIDAQAPPDEAPQMPEAPPAPQSVETVLKFAIGRKEETVKEWFELPEDERRPHGDDVTPLVHAFWEEPVKAEVIVFAPHLDRDEGLRASIVLGTLQPIAVTFIADAHAATQPINPATGESWKAGEMQQACDGGDACATGLLTDCLVVSTVWPGGRIRQESRGYHVHPDGTTAWVGEDHPTRRDGGVFDTSVHDSKVTGVVPDAMRAAVDPESTSRRAFDFVREQMAAQGYSEKRIFAHTLMGAIRALMPDGFQPMIAVQDEEVLGIIQESVQSMGGETLRVGSEDVDG